MIPGLHDEPSDHQAFWGLHLQEWLTAQLGQVACGVPHTYLYVDGNRCGRCGAQV